jgi:hypothetical protein
VAPWPPLTPEPQACSLDARNPLPRLGIAQIYCAAGQRAPDQLRNATTALEEALKAAPAFYDALKVKPNKRLLFVVVCLRAKADVG